MRPQNHPNLRAGSASRNPRPHEILAACNVAGLTVDQAADLIGVSREHMRGWIGEPSKGRMHPAFWRLLKIEVAARVLPQFAPEVKSYVAEVEARIKARCG